MTEAAGLSSSSLLFSSCSCNYLPLRMGRPLPNFGGSAWYETGLRTKEK
jgi:hypothetical protein